MEQAESYRSFMDRLIDFNKLEDEIYSMQTIAYIRHSIDTRDAFYSAEQDYYDEMLPRFNAYSVRCRALISSCPYGEEIAEEYGSDALIVKAKVAEQAFSPEIIELTAENNRLISSYEALCAGVQIDYQGEKYNLAALTKFFQQPDREIRRSAYAAYCSFFSEYEEQLDNIFASLVSVRTQMAQKMGYDTFTPLAYLMLGRSDYDAEKAASFREQVKTELVPLCEKIIADQRERLELDEMYFYDLPLFFPEGNPIPEGTTEEKLNRAVEMYADMSAQTEEFFNYMNDCELLDLETRPGKAMGGYTVYIPDERAPFIFSNFNGTLGDVDVLTHEAGHAFQSYLNADMPLRELRDPTAEACEIHSTSMEFFAYPYMESFFGERRYDYRLKHLSSTVLFVPYGAQVDEFQHEIYAHPEMSPEERKALWRRLESVYQPWLDYGEGRILDSGTYWYRQLHIFMYPFYYLDYALADMSAFEFFNRMHTDRAGAWRAYSKLCALGGKYTYLELLRAVGLTDPFEEGAVKKIIEPIAAKLNIGK